MNSSTPMRSLLSSMAPLALLQAMGAQCPVAGSWSAAGSWSSPSGPVHAMVAWDPDGPGPIQLHYVCGGDFRFAGTSICRNVALFDPVTRVWSAIHSGFDGPVNALLVTSNNELVAAGEFTASGATPLQNVARWGIGGWQPLGSGTSGPVGALVEMPSGDVVAGGDFTTAGGVLCNNVARFDGAGWHALAGGVTGFLQLPFPPPEGGLPVSRLVVRNGELIAGGWFSDASGVAANGLARWDGAAWHGMLNPPGEYLQDMIVRANGELVISTRTGCCSGLGALHAWNGGAFVTSSTYNEFAALLELPNGNLLAAAADGLLASLYEWDGTAWSIYARGSVAAWTAPTALLQIAPGDLFAAGRGVPSMVRVQNGELGPVGAGLDSWVTDAVADGDRIVVAGRFTQAGAVAASGVAVWENGAWQPLGSGFENARDLLRLDDGDLLAAGPHDIARWDGSQWQNLGVPLSPVALAQAEDGDLLAAVQFPPDVLRFDGANWTSIGPSSPPLPTIRALAELPNGDVVVASHASTDLVVRWNGSQWLPFANGPNGSQSGQVSVLHVDDIGRLWCGGTFTLGGGTQSYGLAHWNGVSWTPIASTAGGIVVDLDALPNGDLVATLLVPGGSTSLQVVSGPSVIASGFTAPFDRIAFATAINDAGDLLHFGTFEDVNGVASGGVARYRTGCAALASNVGAGCSGAAGVVDTTITRRAWLGGTFEAVTSGVPANAIAVQVFGLAAVSLPLANVLPQALPGCTLHVSPDVLWLALPQGGEVVTQWTLPSTATLLGQTFLHQVVSAELAGSGAIQSAASSNAWGLTIGAW